jgi:hypothetical protein
MNLAIGGIDGNIGQHATDSFHSDLHSDLRADYILANPSFNMSDWRFIPYIHVHYRRLITGSSPGSRCFGQRGATYNGIGATSILYQ